jgi:hypothetical protein
MTTVKYKAILLVASMAVTLPAQQLKTSEPSIVRALTSVLVGLADSLRTQDVGRAASAWIIRGPASERLEIAELRRLLLRATGGRLAVRGDTIAHFLEVYPPAIAADSATVEVDHGVRWCRSGNPASSGTTYVYHFRRQAPGWAYVGRKPDLFYDPPGPPEPGKKPPGCARDFASSPFEG